METRGLDAPKGRSHGFRFSIVDGGFIVAVAALTGLMWPRVGEHALFAPLVLVHFFLFCNLIRARRLYELIWAAVFLLNFAGWAVAGELSVWRVAATQIPFTLAVVVAEICSPRYHGIFSRPQTQ